MCYPRYFWDSFEAFYRNFFLNSYKVHSYILLTISVAYLAKPCLLAISNYSLKRT